MTDRDSDSLLGRFVDHGDEVAFRELVDRHIALVYAAALRQTHGASHLAEEVAQSVFTLLARQARNLTTHPTLEGWLFTTTRNCARDAVRATSRRRRYEQETAAMHEPTVTSSPGEVNWTALAPLKRGDREELREKADRLTLCASVPLWFTIEDRDRARPGI